ncbi:MAG: EscU/YscU/HrcU family type III secretion system export apparatus switch protein [Oligoflexales bacterium]|nr:EscU/YscU/HrcU family type III secretion system export apparatus switch protein [Oligoflexales bacterium]
MALDDDDASERSELPTDERREKFRERGDVPHSRDLSSILSLTALLVFLFFFSKEIYVNLFNLFQKHLKSVFRKDFSRPDFLDYMGKLWIEILSLILPIFMIVGLASIFFTLAQTRMIISFEKIKPNFSRLNPVTGLFKKILSLSSLLEILKGSIKTIVVGISAYFVLLSDINKVYFLSNLSIQKSSVYLMSMTKNWLIIVLVVLFVVAGFDYAYQFFMVEKQLKMTKKELREDMKQRDIDPQVKGRIRRMQREFATKKTMEATKKATVLITNPTHFSIAIKYEIGMKAPILLAKGSDLIALKMREIAKMNGIEIVENKPLAQTLYKTIKVNQEVPESLYKALSEVISYVFKVKRMKLS